MTTNRRRVLQLVEEVAFTRLDIKLAHRLVAFAQGSPSTKITHQQLAAELGTARSHRPSAS
jgi:CRP/FNR family transcriptional regulator